jgi:hypothetical protein
MHYVVCVRHFNDWDNIAPIADAILDASREARVTVLSYGLLALDADPIAELLHQRFSTRFASFHLISERTQRVARLLSRLIPSKQGRIASVISEAAFSEVSGRSRLARGAHFLLRKTLRLEAFAVAQLQQATAASSQFVVLAENNRGNQIRHLFYLLRSCGAKKVLGLPTSPYINANVLRSQSRSQTTDAAETARKYDYDGFDAISVVDPFFSQNLGRLEQLDPSFYSSMITATPIGSLRYSKEWIDRKTSVLPRLNRSGLKPRVLVLESNPDSNIHQDEMSFALSLLDAQQHLDIVLRPHTRYTRHATSRFLNVRVDGTNDTSSLIDWADVVIFVSSSVAIEAVRREKFVLCMEFATSNLPSLAYVEGVTRLRCRDDLFVAIHLLPDRLDRYSPASPNVPFESLHLDDIVRPYHAARELALEYVGIKDTDVARATGRKSADQTDEAGVQ